LPISIKGKFKGGKSVKRTLEERGKSGFRKNGEILRKFLTKKPYNGGKGVKEGFQKPLIRPPGEV